MRIKVVTDCVSIGGYFPAWHKYYANEFGAESLHVFCYPEIEIDTIMFPVGGVHKFQSAYQDDLRTATLNGFINDALVDNDVVIRVDVDEFLVPDLKRHESLLHFVINWKGSHITARGFDVYQTSDESPLNFDRPILAQRSACYALTALNKSCITRVPLVWGRGFHYCSLPPIFDDLYLFHLKRADIFQQIAWNENMIVQSETDEFLTNYYSWGAEQITNYHSRRSAIPISRGTDVLDRIDFNREFLSKIKFDKRNGLFNGPYEIEPANLEIPEQFKNCF